MGRAIDLRGTRFGNLVISNRDRTPRKSKGAYWVAKCDCGGVTTACASDFKRGGVTSCGCLRKKALSARSLHGESHPRTKEYAIWCGMRQRCQDPNCKDYHKYGGRGIVISSEFSEYKDFLSIMGRCPAGMSLERKDNEGAYSGDNCIWGTPLEQSNNKRSNKVLGFDGETKTLAQWARDPRCCVTYSLLKSRVGRQGWSLWDALSIPPQPKNCMLGKTRDHFKKRRKA